jgi:hypothetical protein
MNREKKLVGDFNERSKQEHLIQTLEFENEEAT